MPYKIIRSGPVVEVFEYERMKLSAGGGSGGRKKEGASKENQDKNYKAVQARRRTQIRRLALANFDTEKTKFVTLTFRENLSDVKSCNVEFKQFIQRMKYHYGNFKYMAVIEFQKRGALHYHMLWDLHYVKQADILDLWGLGSVDIRAVDKVDNVGAYIVKYMAKSDDKRLKGKMAYLISRGLIHPEKITENVREIVDSLTGRDPVYSSSYWGEYTGTVQYHEYNLKRS